MIVRLTKRRMDCESSEWRDALDVGSDLFEGPLLLLLEEKGIATAPWPAEK